MHVLFVLMGVLPKKFRTYSQGDLDARNYLAKHKVSSKVAQRFLCPMKHNLLHRTKLQGLGFCTNRFHSSGVDAENINRMDAESNIVQQMGNENDHYLLTVPVEIC